MSNAKLTPNLKARESARRTNAWTPVAGMGLNSERHVSSSTVKSAPGMPSLRLNRVLEFVDANIAVDLCVSTLAAVAGMSPYYFCRSFKQSTGITPHRYVLQCRMEQAKRLLQEKPDHLMEIAHQVGFADQSQFTRVFHKMVGVTPSQYRKGLAKSS